MKKAFSILILFAMLLTLLPGCQTTDLSMSFEPLSEEAKALIDEKVKADRERRVDWDGTGWNEPYYGTINGFSIVQASRGYLINNTGYTGVAGYGFKAQGYFFELYAYYDGRVYTLLEVYKNGWLTKEQIGVIHERHQQIHAAWFEEIAGWSDGLDPDHFFRDTLTDDEKQEFAASILRKYDREVDMDNACKYAGTVNGFTVFMVVNFGVFAGDVNCTLEIAGCTFQWNDSFMIYACRDGEIYKLKEVYESGELTKHHIDQIYAEHNSAFGDWCALTGW